MLISASSIAVCISISAFASLVGIPVSIVSSAAGLKICAITAGNKKYYKVVSLVKTKFNKIEVSFSKALIV